MPDADDKFVQAADSLIALYRTVERSTLDLPFLSFMPMLIFFWAFCKFYFFLVVGVVLILPVNFIILIRNIFPGHWRYRPFFLTYVYYVWLWIWRGETPTAPLIFFRPLKAHFETRLRRLRLEVLDSELSDGTRSTLLGRIDAALERWKAPRVTAILYTLVLPAIISLPSWYKQLVEFLGSLGVRMPTDVVVNFISENISTDTLIILAALSPGYLLTIPITSFLGKRGVFIGISPDRICFPGGQGGSGIYYSKEREILGAVGVRIREAPIDLWLFGFVLLLGWILVAVTWDHWVAWAQSHYHDQNWERQLETQKFTSFITGGFIACMFFIAAFHRGRTGRL
jgi:hypothetical protein